MLWPSALLVLLVGCSSADVVVESNTSWQGDICDLSGCQVPTNGDRYRGTGNKTFDGYDDEGRICYWFGNTTDSGYVRVYINAKSIFGDSKQVEHENSGPHGAVSACWGS